MITEAIIQLALSHGSRVVIAVSGPQGSGKTTVTRHAAKELSSKHGIVTAAVSIDDFYKPYSDLQELAQHSKNPLLQHRGLPGTHDVAALHQFLSDFINGSQHLEIPKYDKSQHNGAGDRVGSTKLPDKLQCVLLEGWMIGFEPVEPVDLEKKLGYIKLANLSVDVTLPNLLEINAYLASYTQIWKQCAKFVLLSPENLQYIYKWRLQQEHDMIRAKGCGMTDAEVRTFVDQYMPCYFVYNGTLPTAKAEVFYLDESHGAHVKPFTK